MLVVLVVVVVVELGRVAAASPSLRSLRESLACSVFSGIPHTEKGCLGG